MLKPMKLIYLHSMFSIQEGTDPFHWQLTQVRAMNAHDAIFQFKRASQMKWRKHNDSLKSLSAWKETTTREVTTLKLINREMMNKFKEQDKRNFEQDKKNFIEKEKSRKLEAELSLAIAELNSANSRLDQYEKKFEAMEKLLGSLANKN